MSVAAEADPPLEQLLGLQHALICQLRDVEHWRRLAVARLDLAVAAVTGIDEPSGHPPPCARQAPLDLHYQLGIPDNSDALPEAASLLRLRRMLAELEAYAEALRDSCAKVSRQVLDRLDAEGYLQAYC